MRKAFIRSPVDFTRISSRFGTRFHPVLNRMRAHNGVDYAAASGTPIKAAGDGKIVHMGLKGGYGKTIIIQHGNTYSTLYAHMSRYKSGLKTGSRVKQGQVIGYVGQTGLATGPHLHYEFRVNGVHRNPLTVALPDAAPIATDYKTAFIDTTRGYLNLLDILSRTEVALKE
jgi:murein DD-endopeptidase MepM/ murein hydrolase activator NlpD